MVVFSCDACGDSLRKKDVQKHYQFNCRRCESLTCVDCKKQFWGDEFNAHIQCITDEEFKYGLVENHKSDKGQLKQNSWISNIDDLLADRSTDKKFTPILIEMKRYENVPRKKKPFLNWSKCTMKRFPYKVVEETFDLLVETHAKKQKAQAEVQNGTNGSTKSKTDEDDVQEMEQETNDLDKETNGTSKAKQKKRKAPESDDEEDEEETQKSKKRRDKAPTKGISKGKNDMKVKKFKVDKAIGRVLVEKNSSLKMKKLAKKVFALYSIHCDEQGVSKNMDSDDISQQIQRIVSKKEYFENFDGLVQLSASGLEKYSAEETI